MCQYSIFATAFLTLCTKEIPEILEKHSPESFISLAKKARTLYDQDTMKMLAEPEQQEEQQEVPLERKDRASLNVNTKPAAAAAAATTTEDLPSTPDSPQLLTTKVTTSKKRTRVVEDSSDDSSSEYSEQHSINADSSNESSSEYSTHSPDEYSSEGSVDDEDDTRIKWRGSTVTTQ
jgi:hypothetical protein